MSATRAHDKLVGRALGEFVLRERIGEGGFGAVYRASQPALDREAVIKVLQSRLHKARGATERFLREAKLASKLDHPYAAHIYAFGAEPDGELWIAMELVRGTPLDQILRVQGPLALERFVPLLDRVCEVVHTAHEAGIVHRDIKPANVMVLARAGRLLPKLLDFGIAKGFAGGAASSDDTLRPDATPVPNEPIAEADTMGANTPDTPDGLTQQGAVMGSPPYMAPEQWVDAGEVDARTDLYAIGILAYEALTGKPPFTGATISQIALAHAKQAVPPLGQRFPVALDKVLAKVLAKRASDRYPDALAFAAAFRQAAGIGVEQISLPTLDPARRDTALRSAPQPIAEAIATLDAARNAHEARDAVVQVARTIARYLGLLAVACRSRISGGDDPPAVATAMRELTRRALADREWIELLRGLTRTWIARRDAFPIPELVDVCHDERGTLEHVEALVALRDTDLGQQDMLLEQVERSVARLSTLLEALAFLDEYSLVVTGPGGVAERWMGVRRSQRTTVPVRGKGLPAGVPALLDRDGVPVLDLAPLFQVAVPTPGAPLELFLFDGRGRRGAKLVALPSGFEHHDDTLWDWFRGQLQGSLDETEAAAAEERPPYRGLQPFSADDGGMFFGREKLVDAFANRLRVTPLLAVAGRSGAGKSSFVQAGVIPALPAGWRALSLRPGPSPLGTLIARLASAGFAATDSLRDVLASNRNALGELLRADAAKNGPVLLVVDQLEELFTLCQDADERRVFAEAVAAAARSSDDPVRVVFTLRDDFLLRSEQIAALRNRIGQGLQLLTVPAADDLLRIVVEPARRAGYELEDAELAAEMVKEVADQPGALALISFTASKLWELRDRHFKQLTRKAYKSLGGVGGALARHAELTLEAMPIEERALTREAFRHLVTTQNTRAVLPRKELRQILGNSEHADAVMEKLVAARLLVASENETGAETIEIVHEALLSAWPRLVEWRREDVEGARFREQLRSAAKQWDERGRPKGLLWRGDALADYTRWRAQRTERLTEIEDAFAGASVRDAALGRRSRRIVLVTAFVALVIVVVVLATQRRELHDNLERQYEAQGRRLVLDDDPLRALAYLAKAQDLGARGYAHDLLVAQAVRATDGEMFEVRHSNAVRSPRFSSDGTRIVTTGYDRKARIWDARTGKQLLELPHGDTVSHASFSPDDTTVLTTSLDKTAVVWNAATGAVVHRFRHDASVRCGQYSRDGSLVMTSGADDTVVLWELPSGRERVRMHGDGAGMLSSCGFVGSMVVVGDTHGKLRLWDQRTGELVRELVGHHDLLTGLQVTADSRRIVTGSKDGTAIIWDVETGKAFHVLSHRDAVNSIDLSSDGRLVLTASSDRTAAVWDVESGERQRTLIGHTSAVNHAAFSPDGKYIVTVAEDGSVWLWDAATARVVSRWRGHRDVVFDAVFDPSGRRVITASDDAAAIVWKVEPQQRITWLAGHKERIEAAHFSADGKRLVTASYDHTARIWDVTNGRELAVLQGHEDAVVDASFSPDGRTVATGSVDGTVRLWDASRSVAAVVLKTTGPIAAVTWSHDGALLVATSEDGWLRGWNPATHALVFEMRAHGGVRVLSASFSPDDARIITTGDDSKTIVWDRQGHKLSERDDKDIPTGAIYDPSGHHVLSTAARQTAKIWNPSTGVTEVELVGHTGLVVYASWSPNGQLVVTNALDGTARVWDAATGDNLAIFAHALPVRSASFSADGNRIVIAGDDGVAEIHELPHYDGDTAELAKLLRCRVPFVVAGDELQSRPRDRRGCDQY